MRESAIQHSCVTKYIAQLSEIDDPRQTNAVRMLRRACGLLGLLPTSHVLSEGLMKTSERALFHGGYAEIWRGTLGTREVAIKVLRVYSTDDMANVKRVSATKLHGIILRTRQRFCSEVVLWKRLKHPNVLPFLGISTTIFPFCMISDWMPHGSVVDYLRKNSDVDRFSLVSRPYHNYYPGTNCKR
jgi:hypothetical protein